MPDDMKSVPRTQKVAQKAAKARRVKPYVFMAMNSPCEVQVDCDDQALVDKLGAIAEAEAARIEVKYSRYKQDSLLSAVNRSNGDPVKVDSEMRALLDYADACYKLSNGLFDITSGVLRRIWRFGKDNKVPTDAEVAALLPLIGWDKVTLTDDTITLPPGMEIDFGGLGKEYAVDRALMLAAAQTDKPMLVNFGGDLRVSGPRRDGGAWRIAIESVDPSRTSEGMLEIKSGALTTSGDARRFILQDGVRYGHILNPRTGRPVMGAPRSVTIAAGTCLEAGIMSTLAMAKGERAEKFLRDEGLAAWVLR